VLRVPVLPYRQSPTLSAGRCAGRAHPTGAAAAWAAPSRQRRSLDHVRQPARHTWRADDGQPLNTIDDPQYVFAGAELPHLSALVRKGPTTRGMPTTGRVSSTAARITEHRAPRRCVYEVDACRVVGPRVVSAMSSCPSVSSYVVICHRGIVSLPRLVIASLTHLPHALPSLCKGWPYCVHASMHPSFAIR